MDWRSWVVAGAMLVAPGCSDDDGGAGAGDQAGALGYASFRWGCRGAGDLACSTGDAFPRAVALGSSYELDYSISSRVPDEVDHGVIAAASPTFASSSGSGGFGAQREGRVTMLALSGDGSVIDYTTIEQWPITALSLHDAEAPAFPACAWNTPQCDATGQDPPPRALAFEAGETTQVRAEPHSATGVQLLGSVAYAWTVSPSEVATLEHHDGNHAAIEVVAAEDFEVRVRAGDFEQTFQFRGEAPPPSSEGPHRRRPEPPGTGSDTGGSDTGGSDTGGSDGSDTGGSDSSTDGGSSTTAGVQ